jgi:hypothetical protein
MLEIKKNFSQRELLWFGPLLALFVIIAGAILWRRLNLPALAYTLWCGAAVLIVLYYLLPAIRVSVYRAWLLTLFPIGWLVSHLLLALIYYLVLTPIGLLMRLAGYDPLRRRRDPSASSYWIDRQPDVEPHRYFRQF